MGIKSKSLFFASTGVAALTASLTMASTAMATTIAPTTIISDTFPSTQGVGAGSYLQGSTPDGADLPGSTWEVNYNGGALPSSGYQPYIGSPPDAANPASSVAIFPNSNKGNVAASIGFTPSSNGILSLTATLDLEGGEWIAMGFANAASTASPSQAGPWMLMAMGSSPSIQMFGKNGSKNFVVQGVSGNINTITFTYNPATMTETFDASNSTKGADYLTGSQPLSYFGITTPPTIASIFFAVRAGDPNGSNFSNMTLTQGPAQVVPEPTAAGLLGLGGVAGLMLLGRRRKMA